MTTEQARILAGEANEVMTILLRMHRYASDGGLPYAAAVHAAVGIARAEVNRLCGIAGIAPVIERDPAMGERRPRGRGGL